ncbi:MAG: sulfatase, partial [Vicinamibacteria bacterium]
MRGPTSCLPLIFGLLFTRCAGEPLSLIDPGVTYPLPSELAFDLTLPRNPFLRFSITVLAPASIGRGSVLFSARLQEGDESFTIFEEIVRARGGSDRRSRSVNLAAWRGKKVQLTLEAAPAHPEAVGAWTEEIRIAWGETSVADRAPEEIERRPSIVLILVDTLRRDYLGFHGFAGRISPNLDWLARESMVFENAFTQAPWTKPSIASLFTSLHPDTHGLDNHEGLFGKRESEPLTTGVLPEEAVTLAEALRRAGYRTAALVANPWIHARYGFGQGFSLYEVVTTSEEILARAQDWLGERESEEPFFLYLHFMDVHGPYDSPEVDFEAMASNASLDVREEPPRSKLEKLPRYLEGISWFEEQDLRSRSWGDLIAFRLSRSRTLRARYAANVMDFDRRIAPLLSQIRNSELDRGTTVVLTSDHGEELLEHGGWDHGFNLYEHQLRVPLWIRTPGARAVGRSERPANLVDVMPTLLSLAGVAAPDDLEGEDLLSAPAGSSFTNIATATKHRAGVYS